MAQQQLVEIVIAHRLRFRVGGIGPIAAVDVGDDFPDGPILERTQVEFELGGDLDYFGASEASVVVVEPVLSASAGFAFPASSPVFPTGSSGTPNITARTTS